MNDQQLLRYSRHIMLPEIDIAGQLKLLNAHALIIGAGGLGCPAALYLASAGTGTLTISDDDTVELSNLQRQIAHTVRDIGKPKTQSLQQSAHAINPGICINTLPRLEENALTRAIQKADVVLDCSDNFETRYLVNRLCVTEKTPLVSGTVINFTGQVSTFMPYKGGPCYQCLYPEADNYALTCSESGVISPAVGIIGATQALEAVKIITEAGTTLAGKLLMFDALKTQYNCFSIVPDKHCPVCQ